MTSSSRPSLPRVQGGCGPTSSSGYATPAAWTWSMWSTVSRLPPRAPDGSRVDRPRRAPRTASGPPLLTRGGADPRDAALHHLRGNDLRRLLHGVLLHPGGQPRSLARPRHRPSGGGGRDQHGNPALLLADHPLGAGLDQERQPLGPTGRHAHHLPARPDLSHRSGQRVHPHRLRPPRLRPRHDLLRPHGPARGARVHRSGDAADGDHPRLPRPLLGRASPGHGGARDLLALRRRDVGRRVHDRLRDLSGPLGPARSPRRRARTPRAVKHPPNPLRSEDDAFRFLLWFVGAVIVILLVVLVIQSL